MDTGPLLARLQAEDVPCAKFLSRDEVLAHPQVQANRSVDTTAQIQRLAGTRVIA